MKNLSVTFAGTTDPTGYLFSFAKCLSAALRCSRFADFADDAVAASGFAFRMWVDGGSLCPSATSIWAAEALGGKCRSCLRLCRAHVGAGCPGS